jgi:hypothetical protein
MSRRSPAERMLRGAVGFIIGAVAGGGIGIWAPFANGFEAALLGFIAGCFGFFLGFLFEIRLK